MTTRLPEHALIEALLQSPRLPAVAERIDALLTDEAAQRAHFIDSETVEQYRLIDLRYELAIKAQTGELRSFAVPGFVIPVCTLFEDEINRATLRQLLAL